MAKRRTRKCGFTVPGIKDTNGDPISFNSEQELYDFLLNGGLELLAEQADVKLPKSIAPNTKEEELKLKIKQEKQANKINMDLKNQEIKALKDLAKREIKEQSEEIKNLRSAVKNLIKNWGKDFNKLQDVIAKRKYISDAVSKFIKENQLEGRISKVVQNKLIRHASKIMTNKQLDNFLKLFEKVVTDANFSERLNRIVNTQKSAKGRKTKQHTKAVKNFTGLPLIDVDGNLTLSDADLELYEAALVDLDNQIPLFSKMFELDANGKSLYDRVQEAKQRAEVLSDLKKLNELSTEGANKFADLIRDAFAVQPILDTFEGYLTFKRKINQAKRIADSMYAKGLITEQEYKDAVDLLFRNEDGIKTYDDQYQDQIDKLKKDIVSRVKNNLDNADTTGMTSTEKKTLEDLRRILRTNPEFASKLEVEDLMKLDRISEGALDGNLAEYAAIDLIDQMEVKGLNMGEKLSNFLSRIPQKLKDNLDKFSKLLRTNDTANYAGKLGVLGSDFLNTYIINPTNKAMNQMRQKSQELLTEFSKSMPKYPLKKGIPQYEVFDNVKVTEQSPEPLIKKKWFKKRTVDSHYVGMMAHILEHGFNAKSSGKQSVDYIGEGLKSERVRAAYNKQGILPLIQKIYDDLKSNPNFIDADGNLDYVKVYDMYSITPGTVFTSEQAQIYDAARNTFSQTADMAMSAQASRSMNGLANDMYIPWSYISSSSGTNSDKDIVGNTDPLKVRASATYERSGEMPKNEALDFNIEALVGNHVSEVTRDFYLTRRLKQLSKIQQEVARTSGTESTEYATFVELKENERNRMRYELTSQKQFLNKILGATALGYLVNVKRIIKETLTNLPSYWVRSGKTRKFFKNISGTKEYNDTLDIMEKMGSTMLEKAKGRSSVFISMRGGKELNKESRLKKLNERVNGLSEYLFTASMWKPNFESEFENITGEKWDQSFLNNENYYYAVQEASAFADKETAMAMRGSLKGESRQRIKFFGSEVPADSGFGSYLGFFQGFLYNEYVQGQIGMKEMLAGDIRGLRRVSGVATNLVVYSMLSAVVTNLFKLYFGDDEEEKEAKNNLDQMTTSEGFLSNLGYSMAEGMVTYFTSSQNQLGKAITGAFLSYLYNAPEFEKYKGNIESLMEKMYMKPIKSENSSKDVMVSLARTYPVLVTVSDLVSNEIEGWKNPNISITSAMKTLFEDPDKLDDQTLDATQVIVTGLMVTNFVMGITNGNYIPGVKEIQKAAESKLKDSEIIGNPDMYKSIGIDPYKNVSINVRSVSKEKSAEMSMEATELMAQKMFDSQEQIDKLISEGNKEAAALLVTNLYEMSKKEILEKNGLYESAANVKISNEFDVANKSVNQMLENEKETNDAFINSSANAQERYTEYKKQLLTQKAYKEDPKYYVKLEDFGLQEIKENGKVVSYSIEE
jgi:hypothetical protein